MCLGSVVARHPSGHVKVTALSLKIKRDTWRWNLSAYMLLQALKTSRITLAVDVMGQRKQDTKLGIPGLLQNQKSGGEGM